MRPRLGGRGNGVAGKTRIVKELAEAMRGATMEILAIL